MKARNYNILMWLAWQIGFLGISIFVLKLFSFDLQIVPFMIGWSVTFVILFLMDIKNHIFD